MNSTGASRSNLRESLESRMPRDDICDQVGHREIPHDSVAVNHFTADIENPEGMIVSPCHLLFSRYRGDAFLIAWYG